MIYCPCHTISTNMHTLSSDVNTNNININNENIFDNLNINNKNIDDYTNRYINIYIGNNKLKEMLTNSDFSDPLIYFTDQNFTKVCIDINYIYIYKSYSLSYSL